MKTILLAIDYSKNAIAALKYAQTFSKKMDASLLAIHVFDYPTVLGTKVQEPLPHLEENTFKQKLSELEKFCKQHLGNNLEELNLSLEVVENKSVVNGIVSKADEINAIMIIAGMKGISLLKELVMGNTTRQLINKAHCLVLAVPEDVSYNHIKTIVYATDFKADADIEVIKKISGIAKVFDATIKVVHIATKKEYAGDIQMERFKATLKKKVAYQKIEFKVLFSEDIFESLRIYLGDAGADLVVMLERENTGFLKKIFHQDLVKRMEIYGKIPLMSYNENNFGIFHFLNL